MPMTGDPGFPVTAHCSIITADKNSVTTAVLEWLHVSAAAHPARRLLEKDMTYVH